MKNCNVKPLLSVIVPVYNVEEFVEECLGSIVSQDYTNLEVIAVNDGSTDNSLDVIRAFARQYACVTIYDKLMVVCLMHEIMHLTDVMATI